MILIMFVSFSSSIVLAAETLQPADQRAGTGLARRARMEQPNPAIKGGAGLALIVRGLARTQFTGTIDVQGDGDGGEVRLVDGEIVTAEAGGEHGVAALKRLYRCR